MVDAPGAAPPRIFMVTNAVAPDQLGGLQRYVRELGAALVRRGADVTVVSKRGREEDPAEEMGADGVRVVRYVAGARGNPLYAATYPIAALRSVAGELRARPALAHVHYPLQGAAVLLRRRPYVHTFHAPVHRELLAERSYPLPPPLRRGAVAATRAWERGVARGATSTVVLTEYMRDELRLLAPEAAARAQKLPGGVDVERFAPGPAVEDPWARGGAPLLFTARRFVPRTGVQELVAAMPAIVAELPRARLAVAGSGPLEPEIRAAVARLGLSGSVRLLGRVSEEELVGWYRAADLFVMPTQALEGFGLATAEALACGTPAVGTPAGATPELLEPLDPRLVAAGVSPSDLAAAVVRIAKPEGLLSDIAARARGRIVPEMSWSTIADRHLELYEPLLANTVNRHSKRGDALADRHDARLSVK